VNGIAAYFAGSVDQSLLDEIPRGAAAACGLKEKTGELICAVVYDSDISINYGSSPLSNLRGATFGVVAFTVRRRAAERLRQQQSARGAGQDRKCEQLPAGEAERRANSGDVVDAGRHRPGESTGVRVP
jgi:hypothetical protein